MKELALQEACRPITVKEGGRALALPAIQAILRSQIELVAQGNVQAQRAVLAAIQTIEAENVFEATLAAVRDLPAEVLAGVSTIEQDNMEAVAPATRPKSYTEAAQRIRVCFDLTRRRRNATARRTRERRTPRRAERPMRPERSRARRAPKSGEMANFPVRCKRFPVRRGTGNPP